MKRWTSLKFLAFIGVCLVFTIYLAFTIGNIRFTRLSFFHNNYTLHAYFDDVTGLNSGDNVKVAGVIVGKVTGIRVVDGATGHAPDGTARAYVSFEVHKSVRLPTNTQASVRWRNLLGQRYVYLNPPDPTLATPVVLRSGDTIAKTASVVDIGQLFNKLGPIVKAIDPGQVNQFLDVVTGALSGNEDNLRSALGNLATITATLASHDDAIGRLVSNVDTVAATVNNRDAEITTVLNNLVDISTTFSQNTQVVDSAITNLSSVSNNVAQLLGNNRAQLDRVIANLQTLLGVVQNKLPQLNTALVGLPTVASKVFSVGSWGEWLNQIVPCGSIEALPNVDINVSCHLDATGPPGGQFGSGSLPTNLIGVGPVLQGLAGG